MKEELKTVIEDFLPLEIVKENMSVLILEVGNGNYNYYVTDKDNMIPYNEENPLALQMINDFFLNFFNKTTNA